MYIFFMKPGSLVIATTSLCSFAMIGFGVPAGANSPNQDCG